MGCDLGAFIRGKEEAMKEVDNADNERHYRFPLSASKRWGWGWIVLLLIGSSYYNKYHPSGIEAILQPVALFTSYFWLRNKLIGRFSKLWKVSFVAGFLSLFVAYTCVPLLLIWLYK